MRLTLVLLPLLASLSACAEFPELDSTITPAQANAPFPELVPLASLVARADTNNSASANVEAAITPRLADLRARAARLRGPVIAPAIRDRMLRGVR